MSGPRSSESPGIAWIIRRVAECNMAALPADHMRTGKRQCVTRETEAISCETIQDRDREPVTAAEQLSGEEPARPSPAGRHGHWRPATSVR